MHELSLESQQPDLAAIGHRRERATTYIGCMYIHEKRRVRYD